ncbi:MAG: outer membrane protein transport protein [Ignavibacteriota bacterium]
MRKIWFTIFVVFVTVSSLYAQNGTIPVGYNARTFGRGGTSIGVFDNAGLIMSNPAGLSFLNEQVFDINAIIMLPAPTFKNYKKNADGTPTTTVLNDATGYKDPFVLPSAAYVHKFKDSKFTLGLGFFTVGGMGAEFDLNHELFVNRDANGFPIAGSYNQQKYRSRYAVMQGGLTGAYKITDKFSIGVSAHLVYSTIGFTNPFSLSPTVMQGKLPDNVTTFGTMFKNSLGYNEVTSSADMKDLKAFSFNGRIGLAYKFSDKFTAGLNFSSPVPLNFKNGTANMDMGAQFVDAFEKVAHGYQFGPAHLTRDSSVKAATRDFTQLGLDLTKGYSATYDITNDFEVPMSLGFGCMISPKENFRLALDVEWINWSKSAKSMKLTLTNGQNFNINKVLGQGGVGQDPLIVDFPLNWGDAILVKIGGEYDFSKAFTLRLGYAYGNNPIPNTTINPIVPANLVHHFTAGSSFYLTKRALINLGLEYGLKNNQVSDTPNLVASEFNGSTTGLLNLLGHISVTYFLNR